ncbi:hypothetical protein BH10CYA1_BH10CYA1_42390 [soil metagenome]
MNTTNVAFNQGKLALILSIAQQCVEPDPTSSISNEWAVFVTARDYSSGFTADELVVLHQIAEECQRLNAGALKVHECAVEFARIYAGEEFGMELVEVIATAIYNCVSMNPMVADSVRRTGIIPQHLGGGAVINGSRHRQDRPGFFGPFSLN